MALLCPERAAQEAPRCFEPVGEHLSLQSSGSQVRARRGDGEVQPVSFTGSECEAAE